jgi:hypothetical protein
VNAGPHHSHGDDDRRLDPDRVADDVWYSGEDHGIHETLIRVIAALPREVQDFALDRCHFTSVGRSSWALTLPGRVGTHRFDGDSENMWVIVLSENLELSDEDGIVAHEIAHAWSGHDRLGEQPPDCEIVASNLTQQWGFSGIGANPTAEHHRAR